MTARASKPVFIAVAVAAACLCDNRLALAQGDASIPLVVPSGRALRVMLTDNTTVHRVGQTVTAQLVEPVYAYDRIVLPIGTLVRGRIAKLTEPPKLTRAQTMGAGDFSPHRTVELHFESIVRDGASTPVDTIARNETPRVSHAVAHSADSGPDKDAGTVARAKAEVKDQASATVAGLKQKATETISAVKDPGRLDRLKQYAIDRLPYRPQVLRKGTVYDAELLTSMTFGTAPPHAPAPEGTLPA